MSSVPPLRRHPLLVLLPGLLVLGVLALGGTPVAGADEQPTKNVVETAVAAGSFETLVAAVKAAELVDALSGEGPFTVFAPTDAAFARIRPAVQDLLRPEAKAKLQAVLTYHVVPGLLDATSVTASTGATTLQGQRLDFAVENGRVTVDGANVVQADIRTSNGIIHVIDAVLLPETRALPQVAAETGAFNTLLAAAKGAGLVGVLAGDGPLTVFAPTDEAFGKLPADTVRDLLKPERRGELRKILAYHVVPGRVYSSDVPVGGAAKTLADVPLPFRAGSGGLTAGGATIVKTDIDASNGVIHVIDRVMLPQAPLMPAAQPGAPAPQPMDPAPGRTTVVDLAVGAGSFETLVAAVKAAGLVDTLSGAGPFTVFAPTDAAFAKLPKGTVESLLRPENRALLTKILTYHVVPGRILARQLPADGEAETVAGPSVRIRLGDGARIDNVRVVQADLLADNGVVHVIDEVLLPFEPIRAETRQVFVDAIERGAPLFNDGNYEACAAVYATAVEGVLALDDKLPYVAKRRLEQAFADAAHSTDAAGRAWILRYAMDDVFRGGTRR